MKTEQSMDFSLQVVTIKIAKAHLHLSVEVSVWSKKRMVVYILNYLQRAH